MVLGTAQLDLPYGIANTTGRLREQAAVELVRTAIRRGIRTIDTARAYGDAERRIGMTLADRRSADVTVVTKLSPLADVPSHAAPEIAVATAADSLAASRQALKTERLDVVLLHRADHRTKWNGTVWQLLLKGRDSGQIGRIGISAHLPDEALAALNDVDVTHLQMPFNLLDHRWDEAGVVDAIRARPDVTVHIRSVLLQGLLTGLAPARWPAGTGVDPDELLHRLTVLQRKLGRVSLIDLSIAYARGQEWVDGIVIGMETPEQLSANLALFERDPLTQHEISLVLAALPRVSETLLDPSKWPQRASQAGSEA